MAQLTDAEKRARIAALLKNKQQKQGHPLTFAQQRLWFIQQLQPDNLAYHINAAVRFTGVLDLPALSQSVDLLRKRHGILRAVFKAHDGRAEQFIQPYTAQTLTCEDITPEQLQPWLDAHANAPFDLTQGPLFQVFVARLGSDHVLLIKLHHIIGDGWSMGVIQQELDHAYRAFNVVKMERQWETS